MAFCILELFQQDIFSSPFNNLLHSDVQMTEGEILTSYPPPTLFRISLLQPGSARPSFHGHSHSSLGGDTITLSLHGLCCSAATLVFKGDLVVGRNDVIQGYKFCSLVADVDPASDTPRPRNRKTPPPTTRTKIAQHTAIRQDPRRS